ADVLAHAAFAQRDGTRHRDLTELLRKALDLAAQHRELAVDPDERHAADLLVGANGVQNDVRLAVLADRGIGEPAVLVLARAAPDGEDEAARAVRGGLHACGEERGDGVDGCGEVDGDDFARVVPRGWGDDRGAAGGGLWEGPALQSHGGYLSGSEAEAEA